MTEESKDPWPPKAYKNLEFLNSPEARKIRILCELEETEQRFKEENIEDTIVMFGSARTLPYDVAQYRVSTLEERFKGKEKLNEEETKEIEAARAHVKNAPYYEAARELARELTEWSMSLPDKKRRFIVCSGGGPGIMEAANRGARDAGGASIGLGISLPFEQGLNPYITRDLQFEFHYFFVRKFWFIYLAKALVAFPGGFGTMDELFETLTLIQTSKLQKVLPVVLYGSDFWNKVINFEAFIEFGTISPKDLELFKIVDSVEEAKAYIVEQLTRNHLSG
ncbi:MAG: TIGR00730 family Rossman fold protein [Puniceicoccaceae bacterium]